MKNKSYIIFIIALLFVVIVFSISMFNLTQNRNVNFDSQEMFIEGGYQQAYDNATVKQQEYNQYLTDNSQRLDSYGIDFNKLISEVEDGQLEQSLNTLNDTENNVKDKKIFREDVLIVLKQEFLNLNITAYEMTKNNEGSGRAELYIRLKNIETIYDAYDNGFEIDEIRISDTSGSSLINSDLKAWGLEITRSTINVLLTIYTVIAVGIIIYRFIKDKDTTLLIIFTLVLLAIVFTYRKIEDNYYPPYIQINNILGVNQNTEGDYFINFIPIVVADTFVDNGGDFNRVEVEGESKEVDWSKPKSVEAWLDSPYQGDTSVINKTRLDTIVNSIAKPLTGVEKDYTGDFGIGGWNFSGDSKN